MNIVKDKNKSLNDTIENTLRPLKINDFIGQSGLKDELNTYIKSAKIRNDTLDHTLFSGPPGLGKTTLSQIISNELGVGFKSVSAPTISKGGELVNILTSIQENDVLFIDEIHRLNIAVEEILYSAMEDYKVDIILGESTTARTITIPIKKFTLIGATTRIGLISNPLIDRFGIQLKLNYYNVDELQEIILRDCKMLNYNISQDASYEIAKRSRGTPRIAIRLLKRVRDFAVVNKKDEIDINIVQYALEKLHVDNLGLDVSDLKYLHFIIDNYKGGPVGIETLSAGLSEEKDSIEETIEPYLIQQGLINKTSRGRVATEKAYDHLKIHKITTSLFN